MININDTKAPEVTGSLTASTVEGCDTGAAPEAVTTVAELEALPGGIIVTDACSPDATLTVTHADAVTVDCPKVLIRTYTVTDECGNPVTFDQTIFIDDTTTPVITGFLSALTVEGCDAVAAPAPVTTVADLEALPGNIMVTDDCTPAGALIVTSADEVNGSFPTSITRTYAVTDKCGNSRSIIHMIFVEDTQAPVVTGSLTDATLEGCPGDAPAAAATVTELEALPGGITITDACTPDSSLAVSSTDAMAGTCPTVITRTYSVADASGHIVNIIHTISIDDTQKPVVTGSLAPATIEGCGPGAAPPAVTTVAGLEALPGPVTITDGCTPDASLTVTHTDLTAGTCPLVITRTYTVTDECGNSVNIVHVISIIDSQKPVITGALTTTSVEGCYAVDAPPAATSVAEIESLAGGITITDACTPDASLTVIHLDSISGSNPVVVNRKYTVSDECGNSSTFVQIINVEDTTPPTFTAPSDTSINKNATCGYDASAAITGDVTDEADNCDNTLDATYSDVVATGECAGEQVITRTWSLTDNSSNNTTHIQIITVHDNTPPSFTTPPDITIFKDADCGYNGSPSVTGDVTDESDNCDNTLNATYSDSVADGTCTGELIISRTWSLTDDCGNTTTHLQIINVSDTTAPVFTSPSDAHVCRAADCTYDIRPVITGDVLDEHDNCSTGLNAIFSDDSSGVADCTKAGIVIRRWSLTDECGNAAVDQFQTIYVDPIPGISVSPSDGLLCSAGGNIDFSINTSNTLTPGSIWRYGVSAGYPGGVTGSWAGGLTDQTTNSLTDNITNTTDIVQTIVYTFTPHIKPGGGGSECSNGSPVTISVDLDPQPKIAVTTDTLLCYDGDAVFDITTVNSPLHAGSQWRYDVSVVYPTGVTGSWAGGLFDQTANTLTDNLTNNSDVVQTVEYIFTPHIRPGDGGLECGGGVTLPVSVDLDPQPKIAVTTDPLLCYDGDAEFDISTVNSPLHAGSQLRYDVSVVYPAEVTGSWTAGLTDQTANTLTDNLTNNSDVVQTVTYTFTPHIRPGDGGTECLNGVPFIISVDLDPQPKIAVTTDTLLCYYGDAVFDISTVNSPLHAGSQWRYDVSVVYPAEVTGSWTAGLTDQTANTLTDNLTNNSDVVQTVVYTFTPHIKPGDGGSECHGGIPVIISVDLDPQPKIAVTTDPLLCYDGDAVFDISTVNSPLHAGSQWRYDVSVVYPPGVTGSWAGGLFDQTANTLTDNLTNNSDVVQTVVYTFTPHIKPGDSGSECGNGVPVTVSVDLDPQPKIAVTTDPLLCHDGDAVFNISTVNSPLHTGSQWRYNVSVVYPAGVTGSWPTGLIDQTANTLTDNLTNNSDAVQTVTYTFTPHIRPGDGGSECPGGIPVIISVDLDPQPKIAVTTDPLLCYDGDAAI